MQLNNKFWNYAWKYSDNLLIKYKESYILLKSKLKFSFTIQTESSCWIITYLYEVYYKKNLNSWTIPYLF